jgi:hypothetical protein
MELNQWGQTFRDDMPKRFLVLAFLLFFALPASAVCYFVIGDYFCAGVADYEYRYGVTYWEISCDCDFNGYPDCSNDGVMGGNWEDDICGGGLINPCCTYSARGAD